MGRNYDKIIVLAIREIVGVGRRDCDEH